MFRVCILPIVTALMCIPAVARETVYLNNGYSFEADSHREAEGMVSINLGAGTLQISKTEIKAIQQSVISGAPTTNANSSSVETVDGVLRQAALAQGVDEAFVRSVAKIESGLRQNATSSKGALGLMQLMPGTAAELKVDASAARTNALGGAMYLRQLLLQFHGDSVLALAAYNAGPGAVARFGGVPPYLETRSYILKVLAEYKSQLGLAKSSAAKARKAETPN